MTMKELELIIDKYGTKRYFLNGKLHREDGPAIECINGNKSWYRNGQLHREDGPAIENVNGSKHWYRNGLRHRENGPAVEHGNGYKSWLQNDLFHREDGPALDWDDIQGWYYHGQLIECSSKEEFEKIIRLKAFW